MPKVMVVDDEEGVLYSFKRTFGKDYEIVTTNSAPQALEMIQEEHPVLVFLDNRMPKMNGLEVLKKIRDDYPEILVILMTAYGVTETAIEAMKGGAFDYITKPFDNREIRRLIEKGLQTHLLMKEVYLFSKDLPQGDYVLIGNSKGMQEVYKLIGQVAQSDTTVLIQGESGTGKELVARAIHHHSKRSRFPFLAMSCAAIPETLLESELFGYEKGAFSGAETTKPGKFELANMGTIFLDEIADMSIATQTKVLRILQERTYERLGGKETVRADVRIIAATNRDLHESIQDRAFREDLYYRLNVVKIQIPPLRERKEDIADLVEYFVKKFGAECPYRVKGISKDLLAIFENRRWPGNVRELENLVRRALILCKGEVLIPDYFPPDSVGEELEPEMIEERFLNHLKAALDWPFVESERLRGHPYGRIIERVEEQLVANALQKTGGNQVRASKLLGITRTTLRKKMEKFGIHP